MMVAGWVLITQSANCGDPPADAAAASVTGRFTRAQEVADLVAVMASDRFGNLTGADFRIDGGLIQTM